MRPLLPMPLRRELRAIALLGVFAAALLRADPLADAARAQVGVTTGYDPAYTRLAYPGGDVPKSTGVCCDAVVRALRTAHDFDLQRAVHEDMRANFTAYPRKWGLKKPDANIDHRRVPNLQTFFTRQGWALEVGREPAGFHAGDIVTWDLGNGLVHIGVVSDRTGKSGAPLLVHNIGRGAQEEDVLFAWTITGHYRPKFPSKPSRLDIRIDQPAAASTRRPE